MDSHGFEPHQYSWTHALYVDQKGLTAMLTSAGVTPEVNLRIAQERKHCAILAFQAKNMMTKLIATGFPPPKVLDLERREDITKGPKHG